MTMAEQHTAKRVAMITLKTLCEGLGLKLTDTGAEILVEAPHGQRWLEDDIHEMVHPYGKNHPRARFDYGKKQEVAADVFSRIKHSTLTDCSDDCEWCYE